MIRLGEKQWFYWTGSYSYLATWPFWVPQASESTGKEGGYCADWDDGSWCPRGKVAFYSTMEVRKNMSGPHRSMKASVSIVICCCSVTKLCPTLWDPMACSTPVFPILHCLPELAQTHVRWVSDAIQPSHPLLSASSPALNLSQNQGLFQWVSSLHQVAKVLELQHQSFQWIFRIYFF